MKKIVVGNWKMNTTLKEAIKLASDIDSGIKNFKNIQIVICPPAIWLSNLNLSLTTCHLPLILGAQNIAAAEEGSFTGEISAEMVKEFAKHVIIGHSERRRFFGETDEIVNKKIKIALKNNLIPIVCVGEFEKNNNGNDVAFGSINHQLSQSLANLGKEEIQKVIIAYEPVWAIGTGNNASGKYTREIIASLRDRLSIIYNREIAEKVKILYGGSVDDKNISQYNTKGIDGVLVGGASLDYEKFINICDNLNNK